MTDDEMWAELLRRWLPDDPVRPSDEYRQQYQVKFRVAQQLQPKVIAEIGTRAGYSAFAMLAGAPEARYIGLEHNAGNYGGTVGITAHLDTVLAGFQHEVRYGDSQGMVALLDEVDLFHVDGDHSWDGTWNDCALAFVSSQWVLVDDYDFIRPVMAATDHFIIRYRIPGFQHLSDGGFRGSMLFMGARHPVMASRLSMAPASEVR